MLSTMELPVDLRFKLTEEEYLRVIRRHTVSHPLIWVATAFLAISIGAAVFCASSGKPGPGSGAWTLTAAGLVTYLGYALLLAPARAYQRVSRAVREGELNYRFTTTGIELKAESFQARWDWSLFGHFTEVRDSFLIFPKASGSCVLIPKRVFSSPESMDTLRELLKAHLRVW
jgi:hypothetical protein